MAEQLKHIAIDLNNRGVHLVRDGALDGAIFSFAKGLDLMKALLKTPKVCRVYQAAAAAAGDDDSVSSDDNGLAFLETYCHSDISHHLPEPSYVYCSPIEIPRASGTHPLKLSLWMVFNLGLAHHLNGIRESDISQLEKALRLYECVYRIRHEEDVDLAVVHAMALTNNLGHIHLALRNSQKSEKCFEQLLATLIYFVEGNNGDGIEMGNLNGFFCNATTLSMKKRSAPAA
jgi:tetratricopeptide (TPR) repeat protein